jgi:hypothetical protein
VLACPNPLLDLPDGFESSRIGIFVFPELLIQFYIFFTLYLCMNQPTACSFRWFIVAESTVRWFIVREKHCWMAADSAHKSKRTGCEMLSGEHDKITFVVSWPEAL